MVIIDDNSPFRRLPQGLPRKQVLFFDGIRYSVEMVDLAYNRLRATAFEFSKNRDSEQAAPTLLFTSAMLDAWSIIDSTHRLRELLEKMPGFAKKNQNVDYRKFRESTSKVEDLRHAVQHLRGSINPLVEKNLPVWGVLSWWHFPPFPGEDIPIASRCHLAAGTIFPQNYPPFILGEIEYTPPVDHFDLDAHGYRVSLTDVWTAVSRVTKMMEQAAETAFKNLPEGTPTAGADIFFALELLR